MCSDGLHSPFSLIVTIITVLQVDIYLIRAYHYHSTQVYSEIIRS